MDNTYNDLIAQAHQAYGDLQLDDALRLYREAADIKPEGFEAHLGLARTLTRMRKRDEAVEEAQRCIELAPDRFEGYSAMGVLYFLTDDLQDAQGMIEQALERAPNDPEPHLTLAQVLADKGEFDEADEQLVKARELLDAMPDEQERQQLEAMTFHVETYVLLAEGKNSEAIEAAQKAIGLEQISPYAACLAYSNLGILEARARHYDQAIEYLDRAYEMNPFFYRAGSALGRLLIIRKQPQRAAEVLGQVLESMPDEADATTRYAYALALSRSGQRAEALVQYRQALSEGLHGIDALAARVQTIWLSQVGRYTIIGLALAAALAWIVLVQPSPQAFTLVAIFIVIIILQRTIGQRRR